MTPNPYESPASHNAAYLLPHRSVIATLLYVIASIPALYSFCVFVFCVVGGVTNLFGDGIDFQNATVQFAVYAGLYATVAQLPIYIGWALLSKEIPRTCRFHWAGLLWVGNMVTIPCFLAAKYFRVAHNLEGTAVTDSGKLRVGGLRITDPELLDALNRLSQSSD